MYYSIKLGRILFNGKSVLKLNNINKLYLTNTPLKLISQNSLNKQPKYFVDKFKKKIILNTFFRNISQNEYRREKASTSHKNGVLYILSGFVIMIGVSYAGVPLFKMFCESQGVEANMDFRDVNFENLKSKLVNMKKDESREITVKFIASTSSDLLWKFQPCQDEIKLVPGETVLAFFKAKNLTERSIVGIATYSILPFEAGQYFNKIQCFCFEEQRLDPLEEIDMPVFFYIDEQYAKDPKLELNNEICLSYTFFESKGSEDLSKIQKLAARPYS